MNNYFNLLTKEEYQILVESPLFVSLLIASADKELSIKEIEWAEKVTHFRIKSAHHSLRNFYLESNQLIKEKMKLIISELPEDYNEKMTFLSQKIERANLPLSKLNEIFQHRIVDSFKSLALSVAEIDGNLFNFFSHNPSEEKWLGLEMLDLK